MQDAGGQDGAGQDGSIEGMVIGIAAWNSSREKTIRALRHAILRAPLGLDFTEAELLADRAAIHAYAEYKGSIIGCVLAQPAGESARIRQMAVVEGFRGRRVGTRLLRYLETDLARRGYSLAFMHARVHVSGFYRRQGYQVVGLPFEDIGIAHVRMEKSLRA